MSSDEGEFNDRDASSTLMKKRKTQRACDVCRSKKIRCEGVPIPGNRCPNCRSLGVDCTYIEAAKKRGPLKPYVKRLENRINNIDKLLRELCADEMHYKELTATIDGTWTEPPPVDPSILFSDTATEAQPNTVKLDNITSIIRYSMKSGVDARSSGDADDPTLNLADQLKRVSIVQHNRFLGKSSQAMLIRMAMEMKKEYMGEVGEVGDPGKPMMKNARPEFLGVSPWEQTINETVSMQYIFPDFDLALHCIDLYFKYSNLYLPLLHRPTFDKYVKEGLHLTDGDFAPVFLLVCAVGARYSDNPRVRLDGVDSHHSAGWKWFEQVQITKRSLLTPASLCDLQLYCLCIQYLQGSSAAQSCWTLAGIGIRLAHDVGAHRRKEHNHKLTPNDELWKRAFWVLVCMDRMVSSSLGLPCATQDEDFDLDLPVDCDDEYWDNADPEKCFKQPPNKPSLITAFILYLKLHQILAFSLRTIYSVDRSKILLGFVGQHWEQHIVAELDSALNKWVDLVPDHLRWDPNRKDGNFFNQSVSLYATYYSVQISIHRTFIPSPTKPSPLPFPSLTICTNAARSCSHVIYIQRKRNSNPPPHIQTPIFTTGIVLLLGILTSKRSGLPMDRSQVGGVQTCMDVLKSSETRWHSAGILWSILYKFAVKVELPFPQPSPPATTRGASEPDGLSSTAIDSSFYPISQNEIRTLINDQQSGHAFVGQAQRVPLPPSERLPHPPIGEASLRSHSDSQIGHGLESRQSPFSISSSIVDAELPVYLTASYSNDLGGVPPREQVAFNAQAPIYQPRMQPPPPSQVHSQTNHWHPELFEPMHHPAPSGANSCWPPHPPLSVPQQQQQHSDSHHAPESIPAGKIYPMSKLSSLQDAYGMQHMAMGMVFDRFSHQQNAVVGLRPMHSSSAGPSSSSISTDNVYRRMTVDTLSDHPGGYPYVQGQYQYQGVPEQQAFTYPFAVGNDEVAIPGNAQPGFELEQQGAYLANMQENTRHYPLV